MDEADLRIIKGKIIGGVVALTSRTFILQLITLVSTFILGIILSSAEFGIYWVVLAVISFLSYFSDIGLAAALIQMKNEPSGEELATAFTVQQILAVSIFAFMFILSSWISTYYQIGSSGLFLLRALIISFLIASFKTIPSVLLERKLEFKLLVIPQILETGIFYLVAIILALLGFGLASFAWAAVARGIAGLIAIYVISPWKARIGISKIALKHLLSFGTPFQINSILALVKDDLMIIFLAKILPFSEIGYIGWAKKWAEVHLRLIMDSVIRVTFPAYSRLAADKNILAKALEKSLFFLSFFIFPSSVLLIMVIKPMIYIVPRYLKWEPALLSFYLFTFSSLLAAFSSPMVNALNAMGKIKITLVLIVMWTTLTWLLIPTFVSLIGYNGVAVAAAIISFTGVIPVIIMRKYVYFRVWTPIYKPLTASMIMAVIGYLIVSMTNNIYGTVISSISAIVIYGLFARVWMKNELAPYLPAFIRKRW